MDILVLYTAQVDSKRKTVGDFLYSFARYAKEHRFYYLNIVEPEDVPEDLASYPFGGIILHYTLLAVRSAPEAWMALYPALRKCLQAMPGYKVMIPQDEYYYTGALRVLAKECGVGHILTLVMPHNYEVLYPVESTGGAVCDTVYAGYVDDLSRQRIDRALSKKPIRDIDIGYRARNLPYWIGRHGQVKAELAENFNEFLAGALDITTDIKTTGRRDENTLGGNQWTRFLLRSRTMLGCMGGASLLDVDGSIIRGVDTYCDAHPGASFEEVEAACFPGQDGKYNMDMLSPRHFECAMTKTCQLLVEGDYAGIFQPNVHYIEIKKDYSNLNEVLEKVRDKALCEQIAQRCYDDIVAKPGVENPYTYAWFANHVADIICENTATKAMHLTEKEWEALRCKLRKADRINEKRRERAEKMMRRTVRSDKRRARFYSFFDRRPWLVKILKKATGRNHGND